MLKNARQLLGFLSAHGFTSDTLNLLEIHLKSPIEEIVALLILMHHYHQGNERSALVSRFIIENFPERVDFSKVLGLFPYTALNLIDCLSLEAFMATRNMEKDMNPDPGPDVEYVNHVTNDILKATVTQFMTKYFLEEKK